MLTNNFYLYMKVFGLLHHGKKIDEQTTIKTNMRLYNGNYVPLDIFGGFSYLYETSRYSPIGFDGAQIRIGQVPTDSTCNCIYLGKDNTPATRDDYKLNNIISSGIQVTTTSKYVVEKNEELDEEFFGFKRSISVSCTASDGITIGEVGWAYTFRYDATYSNNKYYSLLLDRTTFETPIVLEYQNTCVIDYTIMNRVSLAKLGQ